MTEYEKWRVILNGLQCLAMGAQIIVTMGVPFVIVYLENKRRTENKEEKND